MCGGVGAADSLNPRATITLLVLTFALVGAIVWLRMGVTPTRQAEEARRYATVFDPEDVSEIDIVRGSETVSLRRGSGEWLITAPISDRAAPEAVDRLLAGARFLEVCDRTAGGSPEAGLATPRIRIDLRGGKGARIDFGSVAPVPGTVFARVGGEKETLRVPDTLAQLAAMPLDNLRDPRLTSLVADDIEKFAVRRADGEMTVRRERGRWIIDKPVVAPADPRAVREFLEPLLGLRVVSFGSQASSATSPGSVPGDTAVVSLTPRGGGEALELEVARPAGATPEKVSARLAARGSTLEVDPEALRLFDVSPEALRDRSLGEVEADAVDRIRLESGGQVLALRRESGGWSSEDGRKLGADRISALVRLFNNARVVSFRTASTAQETGLDHPSRRIGFYAWLSENTPEETAGGQLIAGAELGSEAPGGNIYARASGSDETVAIPPALGTAIRELVEGAQPAPTP